MRPLIDTNIISELMRRQPDSGVLAWSECQLGFHISAIVLEELVFGLTRKQMSMQIQWLDDFLAHHCQLLPVTPAIARSGGSLRGRFSSQGITRHPSDMLIAATALLHQLPLATRNTSDFTNCGIELINPFHS
ncbi:MAG: type II toxin-antitoxin system VapC family toxin [Anaerolineales bacterium]|nr:type II toxin-antitoxin system VapC family toxin [Anaerolineales bacterium]